ncbi:HET-domain-containing protein [Setomelanomma holmii]|uniref:HET-domain-containing protein n=1 Tax=Setomelanomma holmii TaxID=210430 RepID=A0A9P4HAG6_9PLEO|nr:HET-domain-containing protein [Setomelanomma holmii]
MEDSRSESLRLSQYVDWDLAQHWVQDLAERRMNKHNMFLSPKALEDVRVIDVERGNIDHLPPNSQYVALSYVWKVEAGQVQSTMSSLQRLRKPGSLNQFQLSQTVTDAMTVCKELKYRYLWIDRLCICQDDASYQKSRKLDQMASIYNQAALAIVAAVGADADYGLVGVSRPRLPKQRMLKLTQNFQLVECVQNLDFSLFHSRWRSRGWTYQEHIAPSTIFFFTNDGLHMQRGHGKYRETFSEGPVEDPESSYGTENIVLAMVEEYTQRKLTYDDDIIRAFSSLSMRKRLLSAYHRMTLTAQCYGNQVISTLRLENPRQRIPSRPGLGHP